MVVVERVGICITITAACRVKFLEGTVVLAWDMSSQKGLEPNHGITDVSKK